MEKNKTTFSINANFYFFFLLLYGTFVLHVFQQYLLDFFAIGNYLYFFRIHQEMLFVALGALFFQKINKWLLFLYGFLFFFLFFGQFFTFLLSSKYIDATVFENNKAIHFLPWKFIFYVLFLFFLSLIFFFWMQKKKYTISWKMALLLLILPFLHTGLFFLFYEKSNLDLPIKKEGPIYGFYHFVKAVFQEQKKIATLDFDFLQKKGIFIDSKKEFPLIKDFIYQKPLPFERSEKYIEKPNVIVFFIEGFSARVMNHKGSIYPDLTPNLDQFAQKAMEVENYYNHTAATFRGILGQISSIYPSFGGGGGWDKEEKCKQLQALSYLNLPTILKKNNYQTHFFIAESKNAGIYKMLQYQRGIDTIWQAASLSEHFLKNNKNLNSDHLSDADFFAAMVHFLKIPKEKPQLLMAYNIQTHAFWDKPAEAIGYGDEKNISLNTIKNFDLAFGEFLDYFFNSEYVKNTILIVTADHSHFPEAPYLEKFPEASKYFIDQIPMMIYDPTHILPQKYNENGDFTFNSLSLTPTILHLLEMPNHPNPFLGRSIFDGGQAESCAAIGKNEYFIQKGNQVFTEQTYPDLGVFEKWDNFVFLTRKKEMANKIWSEKLDSLIIAK